MPLKKDEVCYAPMSKRQKKIYEDTVAVLSKKAQQQQVSIFRIIAFLLYSHLGYGNYRHDLVNI